MMTSNTCTLLLFSLLLSVSACRSASPEDPVTDAPKETSTDGPSGANLEAEKGWDPDTPIPDDDPRIDAGQFMFATTPTSICPTREQAEKEACGNSVEFVSEGYKLAKGDVVMVLGDEPVDGLWRGVRFMMEGLMPAWVRADRLAKEPDLSHQETLVEKHRSRCMVEPSTENVLLRWIASDHSCLVLTELAVDRDTSDWDTGETTRFELTQGTKTATVVYTQPDPEDPIPPPFIDPYDEGTMYRCDETYCDRVVFLLEKTGDEDVFRLDAVADRWGTHAGRSPE